MIGDLIEVAFHNGEWKCVCVEQIRYIEHSPIIYFVYKDADGEHHNYTSCDDSDEYIRGIEITEDFLKKNGFVGDGYFRLAVGENKSYESIHTSIV